jgi:hypothetical protein
LWPRKKNMLFSIFSTESKELFMVLFTIVSFVWNGF